MYKKYKKCILVIFFLMLFVGFNYKVEAKDQIGYCKYQRLTAKGEPSITIKLMSDGSIDVDGYSVKIESQFYKDRIANGECFKYVGINDGFMWMNSIELTDEPSFNFDIHYALENTLDKEITCYYDSRFYYKEAGGDKSSFVRFKVSMKPYGSRIYIGALKPDNTFSSDDLIKQNSANWFYGEIKDGIVTYDLKNSGTVTYAIKEDLINEFMESLPKGVCPKVYNHIEEIDAGYYDMFLLTKKYADDASWASSESSLQSSYKIASSDKVIEDESAGSSSTSKGKECVVNGSYTLKDNSKKFNFNIKFEVNDSEKEFCAKVYNDYSCVSSSNEVISATTNFNDFTDAIKFGLANDAATWYDNISLSNFTCPTNVYLSYDDNSMVPGGVYMVSLSSTSGSTLLTNGENENTSDQEVEEESHGTPVAGCEILGTMFYQYLQELLSWIQIFVIVIALVLSMVDFAKAVASGEEDAKKKAFKDSKIRIISAVIIMLLPYLLSFVLSLIDDLNGTTCNL